MGMKLMLVDDNTLFLEGLEYLLGTHGIGVIGVAKNGKDALAKARVLKPDIILMDIRMPKYNGLYGLQLIKAEMPDTKVIMLTTSEEDEDLFNAIKFGASGYLLKNTNAKGLVDMLIDIEKGETPFSPGLASKLLKEFRRRAEFNQENAKHTLEDKNREPLTDRQLEVLEMVVKGFSYKEVGEALGITERTIKYHMERIIELLHVENKAQVIAYATRHGIVEK